jgi:hypothetical protein
MTYRILNILYCITLRRVIRSYRIKGRKKMVFSGSAAAKKAYDWAERELAEFEQIAAEGSKDVGKQFKNPKGASDKSEVRSDDATHGR